MRRVYCHDQPLKRRDARGGGGGGVGTKLCLMSRLSRGIQERKVDRQKIYIYMYIYIYLLC